MARRPSDPLIELLRASSTPIFVVDRERVVRAFNAGCEQLTGRAAEQIVGETCRMAGGVDPTTIAAVTGALCPPAAAFSGNELVVAAYVPHLSGKESPRLIRFLPLWSDATPGAETAPASAPRCTAVLGILLPWAEAPIPPQAADRSWRADLSAARAVVRERYALSLVVARSVAMARVLAQTELARESSGSLLLVGEGGTGKEHFARSIHFAGPGKAQWFVPLECGRLTPDELTPIITRLLERHEPTDKPTGSLPQPGTVYLADCEDLPRELQARIAEVLSLPIARRPRLRFFGGLRVAADQAVSEGKLRADFAALLSPLTIELPPLRERPDDLPLLAQHFLEDINRHGEKQVTGFAEETLRLLAEYRWPGNLDELGGIVREAHAAVMGSNVEPGDLPFRFRTRLAAQNSPPPVKPVRLPPLDTLLEQFERNILQDALEQAGFNKTRAAEHLGINRPRLYRRMQQLGIVDQNPDE
jgi:DNA-binding NtrC family response regulator